MPSNKDNAPSASSTSSRRTNRIVPVGSKNFLGYHRPKSNRDPPEEEKVEKNSKLRLYPRGKGKKGEDKGNIGALSVESKKCLRTLASYKPPRDALPQPWLPFPRSRRAAVLVALFVGRKGDLYVLLSRRASTLRSFAGDTSLPGGKMDPEDKTIEDTARREAFEEIGLPRDPSKVPLLCKLEPFYVEKQLLVTPVVVLILDNTLQASHPILNATEVTALFSHPLKSFLYSTPPASIMRSEPEMVELAKGDDMESSYPYHSTWDWEWDGPGVRVDVEGAGTSSEASAARNRDYTRGRTSSARRKVSKDRSVSSSSTSTSLSGSPSPSAPALVAPGSVGPVYRRRQFRMHRFLTGREAGGIKPVFGLTAGILIHAARIAYSPSSPSVASSSSFELAEPAFEVSAPDQPPAIARICWAFLRPDTLDRPNLLRVALEEEGLMRQVDWKRVRREAGVDDAGDVLEAYSKQKGMRLRKGWIRSKL